MRVKILLFLLFSWSINAQIIRPMIGVGYNRQSQFSNSSYYNIKTGLELNFKNYLKPEFEINYFLGGFEDQTNYNDQGTISTIFGRKFSILNIGFSPKIVLFKDEDEFYYFQILPKYNFSRIEAKGEYIVFNQNDNSKFTQELEIIDDNKHSIGLGVGIVFNFSKAKYTDSIAINLLYQNIDAGSLISKLNHNNTFVNTKDVFSLEINYYFSFTKKQR